MNKKEIKGRLAEIRGSMPAKEAICWRWTELASLAECKAWYRNHPGSLYLVIRRKCCTRCAKGRAGRPWTN